MTRLTSVCGSQTSSVVLSTHNSVLSTRIKRQYGLQPSPVVLCIQTATLALELLVSIVHCPHLRFLHKNQRLLDQSTSLYGYLTSLVVLCMQNGVIYTRMTSLHGFQPSSVVLFLQNSDFETRLTSLYGSQSSSVVLSTHNSVLSTRIKRLYGFQPSPVVLGMQNSDFRTRITCLYGSQPSSVIFACKTVTFGPE